MAFSVSRHGACAASPAATSPRVFVGRTCVVNSVSPESAFGRWSLGCSLARPSKGFSRKSRGSGRLPNIRAGKLEVFASSLPPKDAKAALLAELDGAQDRKVLAEAVLALEACNPTREPTKSELIKGRWRFAYNAGIAPGPVPSPTRPLALGMYAGGFTPGAIALAVAGMLPDDLLKTKNFSLMIEGNGKSYKSTASVKLESLGRDLLAQVKCDLVPESGIRMRETYKSARFYVQEAELPKPLQYERTVYITYLDEDLMIARDETGSPDILVRKKSSVASSSADLAEDSQV